MSRLLDFKKKLGRVGFILVKKINKGGPMKLLATGIVLVFICLSYLSWQGIRKTNENRARANALLECMQRNGTPITHRVGWIERSSDGSWIRIEVDGIDHTFYSTHRNFQKWHSVSPNSQVIFEYSETCLDNSHPSDREAYETPSSK